MAHTTPNSNDMITEETKLRFVRMLAQRHIIVIQHRPTRRSLSFKFIGADNDGKWDFSKCVAETSGCKTYGSMQGESISVGGVDAADIIVKSLKNMAEEGLIIKKEPDHETYEKVRDLITTFRF